MGAAQASLQTITFDGIAGTNHPGATSFNSVLTKFNQTTFEVDGFLFENAASNSFIIKNGFDNQGDPKSDSSDSPWYLAGNDHLATDIDVDTPAAFLSMSRVGGGTFDLLGAMFAQEDGTEPGWFDIKGTFLDNTTTTATYVFSAPNNVVDQDGNDFETWLAALDKFKNVVKVDFKVVDTLVNSVDTGYIFMDNLEVAVPEPTTWALMGLGLCGLGYFRRKQRLA